MSLASSSFAGQALAFRPAVQRQQRTASVQIVAKESRIGKQPITVPDKVKVTLDGNLVVVKVRFYLLHSSIYKRQLSIVIV